MITKTGNKGAARYELKIIDKYSNESSVYAYYKKELKQYIKNN